MFLDPFSSKLACFYSSWIWTLGLLGWHRFPTCHNFFRKEIIRKVLVGAMQPHQFHYRHHTIQANTTFTFQLNNSVFFFSSWLSIFWNGIVEITTSHFWLFYKFIVYSQWSLMAINGEFINIFNFDLMMKCPNNQCHGLKINKCNFYT
jgi:hypothetical protein